MTPRDRGRLLAARELVVLDLADAALAALIVALELEHPTLAELSSSRAPPTLARARTLVRIARRLHHDLDLYRLAVDHALDDNARDDLPF
jgi:hypothetical protein